MTKTKWKPAESDIQWTTSCINLLKEGGSWGVPMSNSVFMFWKQDMEYRLVLGERDDKTNSRIITVLEDHLGYTERRLEVYPPKKK